MYSLETRRELHASCCHVAINIYDQGETINVKDYSTIKNRVAL